MISTYWLEKRKPQWEALDSLVARCGKTGVGALDRAELRQLALLYRQIAADLSVVRDDAGAQNYTRYLNRLLGQAHNIIYTGRRTTGFRGLLRFYRDDFPAAFRRNLPYVATAVGIFFAAAIAGLLITLHDPDFQLRLLGPEMVQTIDRREMWTHSILTMKPAATSAIMTNNLSVSFMAFASGIVAGLGPIYLMLTNGLLLGSLGAACWMAGMSDQLWNFVALHGVLELPAVWIAGGAGLRIGAGLLFPGWLPRKQALVLAGSEAVKLVAGTIPLLVVAGVLEGFVSPLPMPAVARYPLALLLFATLLTYLFHASAPVTADSAL
jgi:uncharacterized membrane protein SpoIIM required for sporulation